MAENSAIEWTDHTFNPWIGCTKVSPGCDHCYAQTLVSNRMGRPDLWQGERKVTSDSTWKQPMAWNRKAAKERRRARVFCASLADVFDNQVAELWRIALWELIKATPNLDWLLLTKRPQNIAKMLPPEWGDGWPNVWLGTTVENQEEAERRIPHLLAVPAKVRFLSCEPLLGPVDLTIDGLSCGDCLSCSEGQEIEWDTGANGCRRCDGTGKSDEVLLDWVICGGESGPGARVWPGFYDAACSLRDQCRASGVSFFMKQTQGVTKRSMPPIPDDLMIREFPVPALREASHD